MFHSLTEARDDSSVKEEDMEEIALKYTDPDSLNLDQVTHMDRNENVIDLAYKNRFRF